MRTDFWPAPLRKCSRQKRRITDAILLLGRALRKRRAAPPVERPGCREADTGHRRFFQHCSTPGNAHILYDRHDARQQAAVLHEAASSTGGSIAPHPPLLTGQCSSRASGRRAQGAGRRAQGAGRRAQGAGRRAQGAGRRAQGAGRRAQGNNLIRIRDTSRPRPVRSKSVAHILASPAVAPPVCGVGVRAQGRPANPLQPTADGKRRAPRCT
jgi:hypothetical protein